MQFSFHPADIGIPERYFSANIRDWERVTQGHKDVAWKATDYGHYLKASATKYRNLLLMGPTGSGKTHIACALLRWVTASNVAVTLDASAHFTTASELVRTVQASYGERAAGNNGAYNKATRVRLLCIDDLGSERDSEDSLQILSDVIHSRNASMRSTIITTNLNKRRMTERYGERVMSRLLDQRDTVVVPMPFDDYRAQGALQ